MAKERRTVSLDPEVDAYLSTEGRNASETINRLVKLDMGDESITQEMIKMRMDMEKDAYLEAANSAKRHLKKYNQLKERLEDQREEKRKERESKLEKAVENLTPSTHLESIPVEQQIPGANEEQVEYHADKLGMDPNELRETVIERVKA